jgi:hypothetical protein
MCSQYLNHIHPSTPFPHLLPSPTGTKHPKQDLFHPHVLQFCKRKELHFC